MMTCLSGSRGNVMLQRRKHMLRNSLGAVEVLKGKLHRGLMQRSPGKKA
jgi:hypothetical protein